jgi:hypothetical protein
MFAIEVRDASGKAVPTIPPPVPREGDDDPVDLNALRVLPPPFRYRLNIFSPPLAPGTYTLVCKAIPCAPVTVRVGP